MRSPPVVFVVNLLQDINVLRPLVFLAAVDLARPTTLLVTAQFRKRDASGVWQRELGAIAEQAGAAIADFSDEYEALARMPQGPGYLVAASESHLSAHKPVHDLFRVAPAGWLRITLQHGFECVGFLQSREQNLAHGADIRFAADVICGWCEPERLTAVAPSQRHKLFVAGPTSVLQQPAPGEPPLGMGLVCENLHSPRLNVPGNFKQDFLRIFEKYCQALAEDGQRVTLRPHPGGQYVIKNKVELSANVVLENRPIYQVDLRRFAYGISAPSSVVIDMLLADIPVAVWQDDGGVMDLGNYEGLARVATVDDWLEFAREARERPEPFLARQREFLCRHKMPIAPAQVHARYASLLDSLKPARTPRRRDEMARERILYVANSYLATLQVCFIKPLRPLTDAGEISYEVLTEAMLSKRFGAEVSSQSARAWITSFFLDFRPSIVVFCRYSGPHAVWMLGIARELGVATLYHIDDDLLSVPIDLGPKKFAYHNHPDRLAAVRQLLNGVDLVYCSTQRLRRRLQELSIKTPIFSGKYHCASELISPAEIRPIRKIGYMGMGKDKDFSFILPSIVKYLDKHPEVDFELFGNISIPEALKEFGDRVRRIPAIENYEQFLREFGKNGWDIGICPLLPTHFNTMKANNKWVEYTAVGAAVVASIGTVYDECCADGCGLLVRTVDEWFMALDSLTNSPAERYSTVVRAQSRLLDDFSENDLREQIIGVLDLAHRIRLGSDLSGPPTDTDWEGIDVPKTAPDFLAEENSSSAYRTHGPVVFNAD
jgi:hypothetical protein